jgi:hypothetical protein
MSNSITAQVNPARSLGCSKTGNQRLATGSDRGAIGKLLIPIDIATERLGLEPTFQHEIVHPSRHTSEITNSDIYYTASNGLKNVGAIAPYAPMGPDKEDITAEANRLSSMLSEKRMWKLRKIRDPVIRNRGESGNIDVIAYWKKTSLPIRWLIGEDTIANLKQLVVQQFGSDVWNLQYHLYQGDWSVHPKDDNSKLYAKIGDTIWKVERLGKIRIVNFSLYIDCYWPSGRVDIQNLNIALTKRAQELGRKKYGKIRWDKHWAMLSN